MYIFTHTRISLMNFQTNRSTHGKKFRHKRLHWQEIKGNGMQHKFMKKTYMQGVFELNQIISFKQSIFFVNRYRMQFVCFVMNFCANFKFCLEQ